MSNTTIKKGGSWLSLIALAVSVIGVLFVIGGLWDAVIGGPLYYLIAGLGYLLTGILLFRRNAAGLPLFAIIMLGTLVWAICLVGFDFWSLLPWLDVALIVGIVLALPWVTRPLSANLMAVGPLASMIALTVVLLCATWFTDPSDIKGQLPAQVANTQPHNPGQVPDGEWHAYARTYEGDRWSPLTQINDKNVAKLKVAWIMRTKDFPTANDSAEVTNEATPLEFDNTLYFCSLHQKLFAVDAVTGKEKWIFDPKLDSQPSFQHLTCRGVSAHTTPANAVDSTGAAVPGTDCAKRLILPVNDGRIIEVDAATGKKCTAFGKDGEVNLRLTHQPYDTLGEYEPTSPPVVTDKYIIVNSAITDNGSVRQPSGATRAYDVYTGRLAWVFDAANDDPNEMPSDEHPHFHPNSPNSWSVSSYDKELNLVYIPMGVGTPDQWGGYRTKESERFVPGILALNADNGKLVWFYQTVHHDLWDMDVGSQPSLVDIAQKDGSKVPAIYIPTKTGDIFVLDRRTGKPIVDAPEMKVPQHPVGGDYTSPTQPYSALSLRPQRPLGDRDIWGGSTLDQMVCSIYFHSLRYEGPFTPPSLQGTLVFPGNLGMFEWGGLGIDPQRQIAFANPISLPFVSQLIPRGPNNPLWPSPNESKGKGSEHGLQHNYGIPYAVKLSPFMNPLLVKLGLRVPCRTPPWGEVAGIDLTTNKVVYRHRNGTMEDSLYGSSLPIKLPAIKMGVPSLGGPLVTAGNLAFLTSTMDYYIRAYDLTTGQILWSDRLPAGAQSTPMTYSADGKQYIVTYAAGHGSFPTKMGDYLIAYTLEGENPSSK
ncbi:membrane-bound PQQ-dependent dehydrogenase, glucose/quinate/shikimate family [Acetobacteraceae bacterium ESL0709]|nr:membrane-bound PQQ-dependent dehydrogenase, glucose/quinate/shikimate family [Acetobacteraceae bacterium ESL0697]MDF7678553.1 membrane-bound PQQ-dependent dehydrogenase, glucose/quinate/shikimate family [Acetobacteraceae bacterium ESL0709]